MDHNLGPTIGGSMQSGELMQGVYRDHGGPRSHVASALL